MRTADRDDAPEPGSGEERAQIEAARRIAARRYCAGDEPVRGRRARRDDATGILPGLVAPGPGRDPG